VPAGDDRLDRRLVRAPGICSSHRLLHVAAAGGAIRSRIPRTGMEIQAGRFAAS
jgi:hypothetical protein